MGERLPPHGTHGDAGDELAIVQGSPENTRWNADDRDEARTRRADPGRLHEGGGHVQRVLNDHAKVVAPVPPVRANLRPGGVRHAEAECLRRGRVLLVGVDDAYSPRGHERASEVAFREEKRAGVGPCRFDRRVRPLHPLDRRP